MLECWAGRGYLRNVASCGMCVSESLGVLCGRSMQSCNITTFRDDTYLRLTWDGNTRITRCQTCCMRWLFHIDGHECTVPGPVDTNLFQSTNYHILRPAHFSGICQQAGTRPLTSGYHVVQLRVQDCPGFGGFVYDAYTGFNSASRILVEEVLPCKCLMVTCGSVAVMCEGDMWE